MLPKAFHSFRRKSTEEKYRKHKASGAMDGRCVLCDAPPIASFNFWKVIENDFPYDLIATTHHMILPLRHVKEGELAEEERLELLDIKNNL